MPHIANSRVVKLGKLVGPGEWLPCL